MCDMTCILLYATSHAQDGGKPQGVGGATPRGAGGGFTPESSSLLAGKRAGPVTASDTTKPQDLKRKRPAAL